MRIEDAPPPGWYPDPEGGSRLRWWQGDDWADRWRAPPTPGVREMVESASARDQLDQVGANVGIPGSSRQQSEEVINQVRLAARAEAERAAELFGLQARAVTRQLPELITAYTNRFIVWFRRFAILAMIVFLVWLAFQLFAQASLFEWIGDRIDNITDRIGDDSGDALMAHLPFGR